MPASPGFVKVRFGLTRNIAGSHSPYSGQVKTLHRAGDRWKADFLLPPMARTNAAEWIAFLISLRGPIGTFWGFDPAATSPRGSAAGTPVVNGASQTGTTLATRGWTPSQTGALKAGDFFGLENRYHMLAADADADGAGNASLEIEPALRSSPADGAALVTAGPKCLMRLTSPEQSWDEGIMFYQGLAFSAVDSLD